MAMTASKSLWGTLAFLVLTIELGIGQAKVDKNAIESYVTPYVESSNFAGSILIEQHGRRAFEKSYGLANRDTGVGNAPATRFHIASISMQFTAVGILRLIDQGIFGLNTHVSEILPGIAGGDKITIRDLLAERSGLPDINDLADYNDVLKAHQTAASLVAKIKDRPLLFEPGSKSLHEEHSAYNLLALIIETKTGLPFAAAMKKLVFGPAGLARTVIDDDGLPQTADIAKGYQPSGTSGLEAATPIHWSGKTGNASVVTTAREQALWTRAVFGNRLLKRASRDAILDTSQKPGYGWFRSLSPRFHETVYYMNGRAPGFTSFMLYLPREQMTVVVFSNIYSSATTDIGNDVAAIALGLPFQAFKTRNPPPSPQEMRSCAGSFKFGPDFYQKDAEVNLTASDTELSLHWPSGDISPLIPLAPDRFIDRAYWEEVRLERGTNGIPTALIYDRFRGEAIQKIGETLK
jgi:CubicO group peptidase (beta-lactamase class C family)